MPARHGAGSARMVVVSPLRACHGTMRGIITSLTEVAGAIYIPVTAPIVYIKRKEVAASECGGLRSTDPAYDKLRRLLAETISESHVRMVGPP